MIARDDNYSTTENGMKDFNDIETWAPKKLRTLRNNLNNRIASFREKGENAKELQKSHMLYGLEYEACSKLLDKVRKILKV